MRNQSLVYGGRLFSRTGADWKQKKALELFSCALVVHLNGDLNREFVGEIKSRMRQIKPRGNYFEFFTQPIPTPYQCALNSFNTIDKQLLFKIGTKQEKMYITNVHITKLFNEN